MPIYLAAVNDDSKFIAEHAVPSLTAKDHADYAQGLQALFGMCDQDDERSDSVDDRNITLHYFTKRDSSTIVGVVSSKDVNERIQPFLEKLEEELREVKNKNNTNNNNSSSSFSSQEARAILKDLCDEFNGLKAYALAHEMAELTSTTPAKKEEEKEGEEKKKQGKEDEGEKEKKSSSSSSKTEKGAEQEDVTLSGNFRKQKQNLDYLETRNTTVQIVVGAVVGLAAIVAGTYMYLKRHGKLN